MSSIRCATRDGGRRPRTINAPWRRMPLRNRSAVRSAAAISGMPSTPGNEIGCGRAATRRPPASCRDLRTRRCATRPAAARSRCRDGRDSPRSGGRSPRAADRRPISGSACRRGRGGGRVDRCRRHRSTPPQRPHSDPPPRSSVPIPSSRSARISAGEAAPRGSRMTSTALTVVAGPAPAGQHLGADLEVGRGGRRGRVDDLDLAELHRHPPSHSRPSRARTSRSTTLATTPAERLDGRQHDDRLTGDRHEDAPPDDDVGRRPFTSCSNCVAAVVCTPARPGVSSRA